ncbi:MAG TPA: hypothetical protein VGG10_18600 [Rhizomicrobium sp.]|jgi:hypothetical protein
MIRVCVVGDAHASALKAGWQHLTGEFPDVEITFFAARSTALQDLAVSGGRLVPTAESLRSQFARSSGGETGIAGTYDFYIVCGVGLHVSDAVKAGAAADARRTEKKIAEHFRDLPILRTIAMLRQCTAAPVFLIPSPAQPARLAQSVRGMDEETGRKIASAFTNACRLLAKRVRAAFLPQPIRTLAPNLVTSKMRFAHRRKTAAGDRIDPWHLSDAYGAIVLRHALKRGRTVLESLAPYGEAPAGGAARVCVIGDSHVAALKLGWRDIRDGFPDVDIKFFAAPKREMHALALFDDALVPENDALRASFKLTSGTGEICGDYDLYILCGLYLQIREAIAAYKENAGSALPRLRQTLAASTLSKLRGITDAPVWLIATPFSARPLVPQGNDDPGAAASGIAEMFNAGCRELAAEQRAVFVEQPAETIVAGHLSTRLEYSRGGSADAPPGDLTHMSRDFGALVLRTVLTQWQSGRRRE